MERHVLVIDDDVEYSRMLAAYLRRAGYRVTVAEDGIQGQRLARLEQPDVITIDHQMPAGSGVIIANRLRANAATAAIPMVMLTGVDRHRVIEDATAAGIGAVLSKAALTETELREAIEAAIGATPVGVGLFDGEVGS